MSQQLIRLSKNFGNTNLSLYCDRPLMKLGNSILGIFVEKQKEKNILVDGFRMSIGWSEYIVKQDADGFTIYTPDFLKEPSNDITKNATVALLMQTQQDTYIRGLDIKGINVSYKQSVLILKEAFNSPVVYLQRSEPVSEKDSGWYVGILEDRKKISHPDSDYKIIKAYELLYYNPILLNVLALPYGYITIVDGEEIKEIIDNNDKRII